ncbi:hypothetical protein UFOVP209_49 [uncultured Caudovirales phage]|uniref:Uncharacterized protein n=1 Tax=uncultured Caudovirales phage TaxID=2100421 RepID=A0A6J7WN06_9CAUD|nr:hypothetical protein UFOVP209_49 [uncultured Caudovirales phage]
MSNQTSLFDPIVEIPDARASDPTTSHNAARSVQVRKNSQKHELLAVFARPEHRFTGLTSWEAGELSGLAARPGCCYWKRVSELAADGYLEAIGTRLAPTNEEQRVYRITNLGRSVL